MKIKACDISGADLQGIGRLLFRPDDPAVKPGDECSFAIMHADLGLRDASCAGHMVCAPRPMTVSRMERHLHTPEILAAIDGDSVICLAPPQEPRAGTLTGMRAVTVRKGQVFILETGAWHWIPFPLQPQPARFLVIFKDKTGENDLQFCTLANTVDLQP
jgi:hypothetical protein